MSGLIYGKKSGSKDIGPLPLSSDASAVVTTSAALPTAAAEADAAANPTISKIGAFLSSYNGATWDRVRSGVVAASATVTGFLNSIPWSFYHSTTPSRTTGQGGTVEVDARGNSYVAASLRHTRRMSLPAAGAWTGFASLPEGACDAIRVDTDSVIVYKHPPERMPLAVDGTAISATNWTLGAGWSAAAGVATHAAAGGTATLSQVTATANPNDQILVGQTYAVIYTITGRTAGTVTVGLGTAAGTARSTSGTYIECITAATSGNVIFTPTNDFDGSVSAVWVIPGTLPLNSGAFEPYAAIKIVGVATSAAPTTLLTTVGVQAAWYRRPGAVEQV